MESAKKYCVEKKIEDKKTKIQIYSNWYNFFWTINVAAISAISVDFIGRKVSILFVVLTSGALVTSFIVQKMNYEKAKSINSSIESMNVSDIDNIDYEYENSLGIIYTSSIFVLLLFWVYNFVVMS